MKGVTGSSAGSEKQHETEVKEPSENSGSEEAKSEGLSLRDALEVAVTGTKTDAELKAKNESEAPKGAPSEKVAEGAKPESANTTKPTGLQPPATWSADEKADFLESSPKQQEATLRLHRSREKHFADVRREQEEIAPYRKIVQDMTPFLKSMGTDVSSPVAVQKALAMWHEFQTDQGPLAAATYLREKGFAKLADKVLAESKTENPVDEKITPLQKRLEAVESRQANEDQARVRTFLNSSWQNFEGTKNAAGAPKFPDITGDSEQAHRLASSIGSLVYGDPKWVASTKARIPDCTHDRLLEEAYRYFGGRVDGLALAPKSQSPQAHITQSNRAAASVPGRGSNGTQSGPVKKHLTTRGAMEAALKQLKETAG